jgi:hypothetical protein
MHTKRQRDRIQPLPISPEGYLVPVPAALLRFGRRSDTINPMKPDWRRGLAAIDALPRCGAWARSAGRPSSSPRRQRPMCSARWRGWRRRTLKQHQRHDPRSPLPAQQEKRGRVAAARAARDLVKRTTRKADRLARRLKQE